MPSSLAVFQSLFLNNGSWAVWISLCPALAMTTKAQVVTRVLLHFPPCPQEPTFCIPLLSVFRSGLPWGWVCRWEWGALGLVHQLQVPLQAFPGESLPLCLPCLIYLSCQGGSSYAYTRKPKGTPNRKDIGHGQFSGKNTQISKKNKQSEQVPLVFNEYNIKRNRTYLSERQKVK